MSNTVPGGITNRIYCVSVANADPARRVLVRQFGAIGVISESSRVKETRIFSQLSERGIAPRLLGIFANGRIEEWHNARSLELDEMREDHVVVGVANAMADLHGFRPRNGCQIPSDAAVWQSIDEWLKVAYELCLSKSDFDVEQLSDEISSLRHALLEVQQPSPIVYAHNDLLAGNILINLQDRERIYLVDFEYSGYNYRDFDIGNFFCEAMGGTADGFVDVSKYPSAEKQALFCRTYLSRVAANNGDSVKPTESDVQSLAHSANRYGLLAHLYWTAWGLAQSKSSKIDFPYILFARNRFSKYMNDKALYLVAD